MMPHAAIAPINTAVRSTVAQCEVAPFCRSVSQRRDSGTKKRMNNVNNAGTAPSIISSRQPEFSGLTR